MIYRQELEIAIDDYAAAKMTGRKNLVVATASRLKDLLDKAFPQSTEEDSEHKTQLEGNEP